ncbi:transcriptional regulator (plasmid) [Picosynechococcus sp. PCC 7003]|uniref:ligand-binding sensor domain-containing protein n=1 Tax=Picosynechococcus sp. PCC 7003 TaxID=374981 RepID=UPI000810C5BB|nr:two-component regulator propeller domain-containing protein [Picosynechococcus sp. PCC 7003]ANV85909.1 transcriptional regulator [Picosynechococcus sp. PCC 7003]
MQYPEPYGLKLWKFLLFGAIVSTLGLFVWEVLSLFQSWQGQPKQPGWEIIRPPQEVSALIIQGDYLWAGGQEGVFQISLTTPHTVEPLQCDRPLQFVRALVVDGKGILWIGHGNGLNYVDAQGCHTYQSDEAFFQDQVNALYVDRAGQLWVGTWEGAAVKEKNNWRFLTPADGLPDQMVNVIHQDAHGGMWFGSAVAPKGGLSHCIKKSCQLFSTANGLAHNNITSLFNDDTGHLWVGMGLFDHGGLARLEQRTTGWAIAQVFTKADGLAGEKVRSIYQDQTGALWFGSEYDGLARLDPQGRWLILTEADGLADQEVKAMVQDQFGNLWLGTRNGITRFDAQYLRNLGEQ